MKIEEQVPLAPYTTLGVGGRARWFAEAASEAEIVEAVGWAGSRSLPLFVLGGGSNLLVSDEGFAGLVLRVGLKGIETSEDGECRIYSAAAGEDWDGLVRLAISKNSAGIECLAGIPGTVGGTPVQNVGAYGQEVAETIERVRVLDRKTLRFSEMTAAECGFAYRKSIFNTSQRGRFVVIRVDYRLRRDGAPKLYYADLQRAFAGKEEPTLAEVAEAVRAIRRVKGMLLVEGDSDCRSAGSFFKNPVVDEEKMSRIEADFGAPVPHYPASEGMVKLAAAWLIEQAGFAKGFVLGRAGISSRHTLALVNLGGASAKDVLALRDRIAGEVERKFGIRLEMEPVMLGF